MSKAKNLFIIMVVLGLGLATRLCFFCIFFIPSSSMFPTLQIGDIVEVPIKDLLVPKHGEIWVFWGNDSAEMASQTRLIKRIVALPNDTICINKGIIQVNHQQVSNFSIPNNVISPGLNPSLSVFPNDTSMVRWSVLNFGPLIIPRMGTKIALNAKNLILYNQIIKQENPEKYRDFNIIQKIGGDSSRTYTFRKNYYFCLGDNLLLSHDSRYRGFIPEDKLIGMATKVLFSYKKPKRFFIPL
ncbi:MAG: signal peptidase I [Bacteroidales bacterium]